MCGIVGYVGHRPCLPILIEGLKRLEYRGYDSAGVAVQTGDGLQRRQGRRQDPRPRRHARRARARRRHASASPTRAGPRTASPTTSTPTRTPTASGRIASSTTASSRTTRRSGSCLQAEGHRVHAPRPTPRCSPTSSSSTTRATLEEAVATALQPGRGHLRHRRASAPTSPDTHRGRPQRQPARHRRRRRRVLRRLRRARRSSTHTRQVIYLDDGEMAVLTPRRLPHHRPSTPSAVEQGRSQEVDVGPRRRSRRAASPHFMLKEIFEQPDVGPRTRMRGRLDRRDGRRRASAASNLTHERAARRRARSSSPAAAPRWHAGLIGEYLIEELRPHPGRGRVRLASSATATRSSRPDTLVHRDQPVGRDRRHAGRHARGEAQGRPRARHRATWSARPSPASPTAASTSTPGPEIGVASTKAFTARSPCSTLLTLLPGPPARACRASSGARARRRRSTRSPSKIEQILDAATSDPRDRRGSTRTTTTSSTSAAAYNFPVALEGALKLKEISYIHAEGYPAAEMKHGPIALIDENMPVVFICTAATRRTRRSLSNMEEVRARDGQDHRRSPPRATTTIARRADHVIYVPQHARLAARRSSPSIPLQLLAYHIAVAARLRRRPAAQPGQERHGRVRPRRRRP